MTAAPHSSIGRAVRADPAAPSRADLRRTEDCARLLVVYQRLLKLAEDEARQPTRRSQRPMTVPMNEEKTPNDRR